MTDKFIFRFVAVISIVVVLLVVLLNRHIIPGPEVPPSLTPYLPALNAVLNGTCTVLLLLSLYYIKQGNISMHKKINILTFSLSAIFLISYVLFHYLMQHDTVYGDINGDGEFLGADEVAKFGLSRKIYLSILLPHIVLAAVVLPLILLSFHRGLQMQVEKHRKLVRWTFPIWLFVTISGVVVYLMIKPFYHF